MDEIEYKRAMNNLKVLVNEVPDHTIRNPMLIMINLLNSLNERITEMQESEDD